MSRSRSKKKALKISMSSALINVSSSEKELTKPPQLKKLKKIKNSKIQKYLKNKNNFKQKLFIK